MGKQAEVIGRVVEKITAAVPDGDVTEIRFGGTGVNHHVTAAQCADKSGFRNISTCPDGDVGRIQQQGSRITTGGEGGNESVKLESAESGNFNETSVSDSVCLRKNFAIKSGVAIRPYNHSTGVANSAVSDDK